LEKVYSAYQHQSSAFLPERIKSYHLRLLLRDGLAQYAVLSDKGQILAIKEYRSKVPLDFVDFFDAMVALDYFLKEDYASVHVIYGIPEFTLVPTRYFEPAQVEAFALATIKPNVDLDHLEYNEVPVAEATAIFSIPLVVKQKCDHHLARPTYQSVCQPVIQLANKIAQTQPDLLLLNMFAGQFLLCAIKGGRLHLCNAYTFEGVTDIVYFIQLVMDIVKLDPKRCGVYMVGEFERDSELMRQMLKFVPGLKVPETPLADKFETKSDKLPHWRYAYLAY
jgi:Protein of unknown function (DUF3822)